MRPVGGEPGTSELLTGPFARIAIRSAQIIVVLILASAIIWALLQVTLIVIPVLIALILAAAISPLVNWMRRHGVPSILATWITYLLGLLVIGGLITLITLAVRNQWSTLIGQAQAGFQRLQEFLAEGPLPIDQEQIDQAVDAVVDYLTSAQFGRGAVTGLTVVGELATGTVLVVVVLFFFLKDGGKIWEFFLTPFNGQRLARGHRVGRTSMTVLGGYVRGTAIIAFVDAVAIGLGLWILQVPLALPLAVIVFLTAFIPLVGATLAGILAALVALVANGPVTALIVVAIVIAVNQLEGDLLAPVVMGTVLKLHPLVILIALTVGTILGGIAGAVLAVPITAVAWAIVQAWNRPEESDEVEEQAVGGESPA